MYCYISKSFTDNSKMAEQFLSSRCDELESEVQELREQVGFLCVVRTVGHVLLDVH